MDRGAAHIPGVPGFPPGASWGPRSHAVLGSCAAARFWGPARPHGFGGTRSRTVLGARAAARFWGHGQPHHKKPPAEAGGHRVESRSRIPRVWALRSKSAGRLSIDDGAAFTPGVPGLPPGASWQRPRTPPTPAHKKPRVETRGLRVTHLPTLNASRPRTHRPVPTAPYPRRATLQKLYACTIFAPMPHEPGSVIRNNPLALFLTWTTYGPWLPGDARGWTDHRGTIRVPNPRLRRIAAACLKREAVVLGPTDRDQVEQGIREHCRFRGWHLLAASCRSTHVHVVVAAENHRPDEVLRSLKAWCSRRLAARVMCSTSRWSRGGSVRRLYESRDVEAVVVYVAELQDRPRDG